MNQETRKTVKVASQRVYRARYRSILASWRSLCENSLSHLVLRVTYRQENITTVHQHHDKAPKTREIVSVTCSHEYNGDSMVGHHLDMILPASLSIENQYLVEVKGSLGKIIKFDSASQGDVRIIQPQLRRVQHSSGKVVVHILGWNVRHTCLHSVDQRATYDTKSEIYGVVYERPALLGESQHASVYPARISF